MLRDILLLFSRATLDSRSISITTPTADSHLLNHTRRHQGIDFEQPYPPLPLPHPTISPHPLGHFDSRVGLVQRPSLRPSIIALAIRATTSSRSTFAPHHCHQSHLPSARRHSPPRRVAHQTHLCSWARPPHFSSSPSQWLLSDPRRRVPRRTAHTSTQTTTDTSSKPGDLTSISVLPLQLSRYESNLALDRALPQDHPASPTFSERRTERLHQICWQRRLSRRLHIPPTPPELRRHTRHHIHRH